jgi:PAS domain S-box-containing protein
MDDRIRAFFDDAPDGILVGQLFPDGARCADANSAFCEMLGYSRRELVGMKFDDLAPPNDWTVHLPGDLEVMRAGGTAMREGQLRRKDGSLLPTEGRGKMLDESRWLAFVRDISYRKRAERQREESLAWLRCILDQCPAAMIFLHGPDGVRVDSNPQARAMFGGQGDAAKGFVGSILAPDGRPLEIDELPARRALLGERFEAFELLVRRPDGSTTPMFGSAAPLVGRDGKVLGAIGVFQDITARVELERLRAEWSSVVAHDLRQPLAAISLHAQALSRATDGARVPRVAERILAAATRLTRMVGDLMDLSRLDARRLELLRQPVNVPELVRASVERMALEAPARRFDVRIQGDVPDAFVDPDRIAQVLENLLTNAVKYGTGDTPVIVTVAHDSSEVVVAVTNEGRPLSADERAGIFERFRRTDSAKMARIPGNGLGLYIARSLVEAHGGRITVESAPAGTNTFRFTLPVVGA